jgi:hypothetical protein
MALFSFFKTARWNNDPMQRQLAQLLGEAAVFAVRGDIVQQGNKQGELVTLLANSGWGESEKRDRIVHACSMVKLAGSRRVYGETKDIAKDFYMNSFDDTLFGKKFDLF